MDNDENKIKEENELINNSSFCEEFSGIIGKDLFKKEREDELAKKKIKETVLDHKIFQKMKKETKISSFIQSQKINELQNSLNISLTDKNQTKKEFLQLRTFPDYDINDYIKIKERVEKNLLNITNFLLNKKLKFNFTEINPNKKVGPLLPLTRLIESNYFYKQEYQNEMQQKYLRFKNYICNFRTIYGDGNCFYRACMFRYIELLIFNKKINYIKLLILDMNNCFSKQEAKSRLIFNNHRINSDLIIQIMIIIYELVLNDNIIQAHQAFYKAIICSKDFDFLLVFYFRFILYEYIKNNENKLYMENFQVLIGNLLPANYEKDGVFDFNSFYQNYLLKMFIPAEKIIVYLTPFVLGINLEIVLFDDNEDDIVKHFNFCDKDNDKDLLNIKQSIFLINRKYHYENVFNYFDNKNFNDVFKYYRNDLNPIFIKEDSIFVNLYNKIKNGNNNNNNNENKPRIDNNKNIKENETNNNQLVNFNDKICIICSSPIYMPNKTIKNICQSCLFKEFFSQIKKYYIDYIKLMIPKINQVTREDLYNSFLKKVKVNFYEKVLDINEVIEEMEFTNKNVSYINQLMSSLKRSICLYCGKDINNSKMIFRLPCGCSFCSGQHLEYFFKKLVKYKLSYNYKCICAIEYKPWQTFELCTFLKNNKIYGNNEVYVKHLSQIFQNFCCNCGQIKNKLIPISIDSSIINFHNICEECFKGNNPHINKILHCLICNKKHTYI